jgi:hypothetical protein
LESKLADPSETSHCSLAASVECQQLVADQGTYVGMQLKDLRRIVKQVQLLRVVIPSRHYSLSAQKMVYLLALSDSVLNERPDL